MTLYYLAYGSNLHPERLRSRAPSAELLGAVLLAGWDLRFHKRSWADDSAKCNLVFDGRSEAHAAVFSMAEKDKPALDRYEGHRNGYFDARIEVKVGERERTCFTYLAEPAFIDTTLRPFDWYKRIVLAGAIYHAFPERYLDKIAAVETAKDPDEERAKSGHEIADRCLGEGSREAGRPGGR